MKTRTHPKYNVIVANKSEKLIHSLRLEIQLVPKDKLIEN